jgi:hypothetical protein
MGFRIQRRVDLSGGLGLNVSRSGVSPSLRTRWGAIGPRGFSIRTGIPGLTFRGGPLLGKGKKGSDTAVLLLVFLLFGVVLLVAWNLIRFLIWAVRELIKAVIRLFSKPSPPVLDPEHRTDYRIEQRSVPAYLVNEPMIVTAHLAPDGSFVAKNADILRISIGGSSAVSSSEGSGIVVHFKKAGDTIVFGEVLYAIHDQPERS